MSKAQIALRDPMTGELVKALDGSIEPTVDFDQILGRLMHNPLWGENYNAIKAQHEILSAWGKAKKTDHVLAIAEEDWHRLKQAVEFPKPVGFGYHPLLLSQLLPLLAPIMDAVTTDPRK